MWVWTDDRVSELQRLFKDGLSFTQISKSLGDGCSRCAALGKAKRLKLERGIPNTPPRVTSSYTPPKTQPMPKLREIKHVGEPISILELTRTSCRWPVSGEGADTMFCGAQTATSAPYCQAHCGIGLVKPRCAE